MATAIANGIVIGVINLLVSRLISVIEEDWKLRSGLKEDLRNIKDEMEAINAFIIEHSERADAQASEIREERIREVQELAYDIEDCVDNFVRKVTCDPDARWFQRGAHHAMTVRTRVRFAKEIKKLMQRSSNASNRIKDWKIPGNRPAVPAAPSPPYTPQESDFDAIQESKEEILELIGEAEDDQDQASSRQLKVISILGCQGLGKATLAKLVYDSPETQKFQCRAEVEASSYEDGAALLKALLVQVAKTKNTTSQHDWQNSNDAALLSRALRDHLHKEERYLIVIDDLKTTKLWNTIESALPVQGNNGRVIVTTCIGTVAKICTIRGGFVYQMKSLSWDHAKSLLSRATFGSNMHCTEEFQRGSESILKKCDGLPLALVSFGRYLSPTAERKTEDEIRNESTRLGYHLENQDSFARMNQVLMQSYSSLPLRDHKICLLSVSIFPEGHKIKRKSLVRLWLAEGLIKANSNDGDELVAEQYFDELIDRNFIRPVDISASSKVKTCQVHGVMLDFIAHKSVKENFIALVRNGKRHKESQGTVRRLSIQNSGMSRVGIDLSRIRSLAIFSHDGKDLMDLRRCKLVRVLALERCKGINDMVLVRLCELVHLKYVSLRDSDASMIPKKIAKLLSLETLDMRGTNVERLPMEVLTLPQLAHLFGQFQLPSELSGAGTNNKLMKFFSEESKLKTLAGFFMDESPGFEHIMREMNCLTKVKILSRTNSSTTTPGTASSNNSNQTLISCLESRFMRGKALESLSIDFGDHSIDFLHKLNAPFIQRSIKLRGRLRGPPKFMLSLHDLKELSLLFVGLMIHELSVLQALRHLSSLKVVEEHRYFGDFIVQKNGFQNLKKLCFEAPILPQVSIEKEAMPHLAYLQLLCDDLRGLPAASIEHLTGLKEITLNDTVSEQTRKAWDEAAKRHCNRPIVKTQRRSS